METGGFPPSPSDEAGWNAPCNYPLTSTPQKIVHNGWDDLEAQPIPMMIEIDEEEEGAATPQNYRYLGGEGENLHYAPRRPIRGRILHDLDITPVQLLFESFSFYSSFDDSAYFSNIDSDGEDMELSHEESDVTLPLQEEEAVIISSGEESEISVSDEESDINHQEEIVIIILDDDESVIVVSDVSEDEEELPPTPKRRKLN